VKGKFAYPTGRQGAEILGYEANLISSAPGALIDSFCGVGCPFSLGDIRAGETILDVGSGGGFDLFCASKKVGPNGRVSGVDLTPEMVEKSKASIALAGLSNVFVQAGRSDQLPFEARSFDVVISNGVFNLSPEKERTYSEIMRVLKPGGRLQFADMILREDLPVEATSAKAWSD
jgi:ubiquinone/menaquinone biosynthesis C-methylase UbiE